MTSTIGASRAVLEDVLDALKDAALGRHGPRSPRPENGDGGGGGGGAKNGGPGGEPDAETRRNAVRSLVSLCEEVGVGGRHGKAGLNGSESCGSGGGGNQGQPPEGGGGSGARASPASNGLGEGPADSGESGGVGGDGSDGWCPAGLTLEGVEGVLVTLLAAAEDYSVDNRGDVGSWCRVEALTGMERLLRLASTASRGLPLANRGESLLLTREQACVRACVRGLGRRACRWWCWGAVLVDGAEGGTSGGRLVSGVPASMIYEVLVFLYTSIWVFVFEGIRFCCSYRRISRFVCVGFYVDISSTRLKLSCVELR